MRLQGFAPIAWKRGVSRGDDGRRGELGYRNMIGMPVSAVGSEGHDDIGSDPPQVPDNGGNSFAGISLLSPAYLLSVERWPFHTEPPDH